MKLTILALAITTSLAMANLDQMARGGRICQSLQGWKKEVCYSQMACRYMNQLRRLRGLPAMAIGTKSMLRNALAHSKRQSSRGDLFHQEIQRGIRVGQGQCMATLSAENVAMFMNPRVRNPAAQCTEQWRTSPGHMANMMSRTSKICAVGIWRDRGGSWWCTQTFSWDTPKKDCSMGTAADEAPTPPEEPMDKPAEKPMDRRPNKPMDRRPNKPMNRGPKNPRNRRSNQPKNRRNKKRMNRAKRMMKCKRHTVLESRNGGRRQLVRVCRASGGKCMCKLCIKQGRRRFCFERRYLNVVKRFFFN